MKEWLTVKDLEKELCVSRSTVYRAVKHLPMTKVGRRLVISRKELERFIEENDGFIPTHPIIRRGPKKKGR